LFFCKINMNFFRKLRNFLRRKPAPSWIIAIILSFKWKCRVAWNADIHFPWNVRIGKGANVGKCLIIATGNGIEIGSDVSIGYGTVLDALGGFVNIDDFSSLGPYVVAYGQGGLQIGSYSMIACHSSIVASSHINSSVEIPIKMQGTSANGIIIANDVWIGANVVIQDGVELGRGVIVGSGAVVRSSFPEFSIIAGVPAKVISTRQ
jgi:acetyltransferase-like isoleucine patch superfamily enzyme